MNYQEFKNKYLWVLVDYDKNWFRCPDIIKCILEECYQVGKIGTMWDAIDYLESLPEKYPQFKRFLSNNKQLTAGDIIVAPKLWIKRKDGTLSGHIAIFDSYWPNLTINVLEQNGRGGTNGTGGKGNEIRIKNYPLSTFKYFITNKPLKEINPKKIEYKANPDFTMGGFIEKREGKFIDADGIGGAVCNDLVKQFLLEKYSIPVFTTNAYYFRTGNFLKEYWFECIEMNEETAKAIKEGDIFLRKWSVEVSGHIGICLKVDLNYHDSGMLAIHTFEQNIEWSECIRYIRWFASCTEILRKV